MVILVFAVGQLAVDQVAQCVVGVFDAVVFFEAVAADKVAALSFGCFVGKDVVGWVEGEGFAAAGLAVAGFLNPSDFVVNVMEDAASLVGTLNEVAGFVVGIAAVDGAAGQRVLFAVKCLCAVPDRSTGNRYGGRRAGWYGCGCPTGRIDSLRWRFGRCGRWFRR